ncbi:unnamed protein product [Rhizophagus irregularis]|uniref:Uncharacterized protein n=1 Tax=Rhizophagus irregularis TaxID=588596 RepID=A0A915ZZ84_9GLOM|nr:hypothetical protein RIR_jg1539.t1 [Rhizophagus irregularis DAOM 181602=DAOM 197198]CAB4493682.1 unnamed protein product [Rhizophagus irregularis]CAB5394645.1 unnamed protein product [Rhizophagus irregularis]
MNSEDRQYTVHSLEFPNVLTGRPGYLTSELEIGFNGRSLLSEHLERYRLRATLLREFGEQDASNMSSGIIR